MFTPTLSASSYFKQRNNGVRSKITGNWCLSWAKLRLNYWYCTLVLRQKKTQHEKPADKHAETPFIWASGNAMTSLESKIKYSTHCFCNCHIHNFTYCLDIRNINEVLEATFTVFSRTLLWLKCDNLRLTFASVTLFGVKVSTRLSFTWRS